MSNKLQATAEQLDRCDVCGIKTHRKDLVRTSVEFLDFKSENFFYYSSYDGSYWVVDDAADAGSISYGNRMDHARTQVPIDQPTAVGGMSLINGVQTWTGDGLVRMTEQTLPAAFTTTLIVSAQIGPHEENTTPDMTVAMGVLDKDTPANRQAVRTWTIDGMTRVWFSELASVLDSYGYGTTIVSGVSSTQQSYYFDVTCTGKWWINEIQLEANTDLGTPETFVPTNTGTYYATTSDTTGISSRKVCPRCFEYVFKRSEIYGRTDEQQVAYPVRPHTQEF